MKIPKGAFTALVIVILIALGIAGGTLYQKNKAREEFAGRILSQGGRWDRGETIQDLKKSIAVYERRLEQYVGDAAKTGTYWKLLAARLQDRGMHGEALLALEHAIYYTPEDPILHYYTGLSAGIMAKSVHVFPGMESADNERDRYYALAEEAYLRAIELDDRYLRPRYGLGVLYVFELDRPEEAIPHLERCLEISTNDVDTMFVLARAFYMLGRKQEAVNLYDRIIAVTKDSQKKTDAQNNRQLILGQTNG